MAAYTTIDDPSAFFKVITFTGDGNTPRAHTFSDTDTDMQPDLIWLKKRTPADEFHTLTDAVRGVGKHLIANNTDGQATNSNSGYISAFGSDGFTTTNGTENELYVNTDGATYVGWCWKAGGSTSSNTTGATSSTVSLNSTAKFSIVQWTGTGSTTTVGHSLGVVPDMFITKSTASGSWGVYNQGAASSPEDGLMTLNGNSAWYDHTAYYNDTAPTSTVFTVNSDASVNHSSNTMISYCFSSVQGYSKFGSYTWGTGNVDGAYVFCGFRPALVILKRSDGSDHWWIHDNKRTGGNGESRVLYANTDSVENDSQQIDLLANGFKIRTNDAGYGASGGTYVYMAFADAPFVNSNGVPATAF